MLFVKMSVKPQEELITQLAGLEAESSREEFLRKNPQLREQQVVLRMADEVAKIARVDIERADRMAQTASWLAEGLDDDYCRARGPRPGGHRFALKAKHQRALQSCQKCLALFERGCQD